MEVEHPEGDVVGQMLVEAETGAEKEIDLISGGTEEDSEAGGGHIEGFHLARLTNVFAFSF